MSKVVRISDEAAQYLKELSQITDLRANKIIENALKFYFREQFIKKANEAYAQMKKNPRLYKEYQDELREWDVTLSDGFEI